MKYIIMCGGQYREWETPRHLLKINGEEIVARTIRLLRENGVEDIAISTHDKRFKEFGVPILEHDNFYYARSYNHTDGHWCNAFYPMDEPVCYVFGDVVFSPKAIKTIVETDTKDVELFGSAEPFAEEYPRKWHEPFALKVKNTTHLHEAIEELKDKANECWRKPLMWELWSVIKGRSIAEEDLTTDYTIINDYTCDIDHKSEIPIMEKLVAP